jgi:hypothetical protein
LIWVEEAPRIVQPVIKLNPGLKAQGVDLRGHVQVHQVSRLEIEKSQRYGQQQVNPGTAAARRRGAQREARLQLIDLQGAPVDFVDARAELAGEGEVRKAGVGGRCGPCADDAQQHERTGRALQCPP